MRSYRRTLPGINSGSFLVLILIASFFDAGNFMGALLIPAARNNKPHNNKMLTNNMINDRFIH